MNFKDIGKRIGKDPTTISKEVKKHLVIHTNGFTTLDECCLQGNIIAVVVIGGRNMLL